MQTNNAKHGYFFDLDGTLVDTHESNTVAYMRAITEVLPDAPIDRSDLRQRITNGEHCADFIRALVPGVTDGQIKQIAKLKAQYYPESIPLSRLNTELIERMRAWKKDPNSILVLVTTAKRVNAERVLEFHGINELFDFTVFGDGIEHLKPAPDIYLEALRISGLEPSQAEAFEDSQSGLAAAKSAHIPVTHITWASE